VKRLILIVPAALFVAAASARLVAGLFFIEPSHAGARGADVFVNGVDASTAYYSPIEAYAALADTGLRGQYQTLATAFHVSDAKSSAWINGADFTARATRSFWASEPVPHGGRKVHADILAVLRTWPPVRRDASRALKYCRRHGHIMYCPNSAGLGRAHSHVDAYLAALRRLDLDSGIAASHATDENWDLANDSHFWIYGRPYQPNPPSDFLASIAPYVGPKR
jgi:hypothetical protein